MEQPLSLQPPRPGSPRHHVLDSRAEWWANFHPPLTAAAAWPCVRDLAFAAPREGLPKTEPAHPAYPADVLLRKFAADRLHAAWAAASVSVEQQRQRSQ